MVNKRIKSRHDLGENHGFSDEHLIKLDKIATLEDKIEWMKKEPGLFAWRFPEFSDSIKQIIQDYDPILSANLIDCTPSIVEKFISEIRENPPSTKSKRTKLIREQIELINEVLRPAGFFHEEERNAVTRVKDELIELRIILDELTTCKTFPKTDTNTTGLANDPDVALLLVEDTLQNLFKTAEDKAIKEEGNIELWPRIRIASFVEILFSKKWLADKKDRTKASNNFSKARYGINVEIQLKPAKKLDRENNKNNSVKGKPPLKNYFK